MDCVKCREKIKEREVVYCGICYINQMWELDKLESIKKIIDEIIQRSNLEKTNPYNKNDYEDLF